MIADWEPNINRPCQQEGGREREGTSVPGSLPLFWQWECHRNPLGDQEYKCKNTTGGVVLIQTHSSILEALEFINHAVKW